MKENFNIFKQIDKDLKPIRNAFKQIEETFKPAQDFSRLINERLKPFGDFLNQMDQLLKPIRDASRQIEQNLKPVTDLISVVGLELLKNEKNKESCLKTGWLPYYAIPLHYFEECQDNYQMLDVCISGYFKENWNQIRQDIERRISNSNIEKETKDTLNEMFIAHECGLYRSVIRVIFPEIERIIRARIFNDQGYMSSKKMVEKWIDTHELNDLLKKRYHLALLDKLMNHIYKGVTDSERQNFEVNFCPNRHAAMHGLVIYSTFKHSMNMIIMTDYIFQILPKNSTPLEEI